MYVFAAVAFLGLAVCKLVDLSRGFYEGTRTTRTLVALILGVGLAWLTDYSMFGAWGIAFRDRWMEIVGTGLGIAGAAAVWHEVLDMLSSYARRVHDQATEIETRIPRAA